VASRRAAPARARIEVATVVAAIGDIGGVEPRGRAHGDDGIAEPVADPDGAVAGMGDRQAVLLVEGEAIGAGEAARQLHEDADFGRGAVRQQAQTPDAVRPRHREVEHILLGIEHEPVRRGDIVDDTIELTVGAQAIHAARGVVHAGLALIGEIEVPVGREHQVVDPAKAFQAGPLQHRRHRAGGGVDGHDAVAALQGQRRSARATRQQCSPAVACPRAKPGVHCRSCPTRPQRKYHARPDSRRRALRDKLDDPLLRSDRGRWARRRLAARELVDPNADLAGHAGA
jgi:hypothetical protein